MSLPEIGLAKILVEKRAWKWTLSDWLTTTYTSLSNSEGSYDAGGVFKSGYSWIYM